MFDTSLVRARSVAAPRRFGLLAISVALHTAIAVAAIATSIASIDFPGHAPRQFDILRPVAAVSLPPPLGRGEDVAKVKQVSPPPVKQSEPPREITAPAEVPDDVPVVDHATATPSDLVPGTGSSSGEATGDGGGSLFGVEGGVGDGPTVLAGPPGDGPPLQPGGEVHPAKVLRRVEPRYPTAMLPARLQTAVVTVRCVIDRNGRVRDPEVIESSWAPFNQSVLEAVRQWKFAPGTMRGHAVDTWFELTVTFRVR